MTKISLLAARINSNLSQQEVANALTKHFNIKYSRQRVSNIEKNPGEATINEALFFSKLYKLPIDNLFFDVKST